MTGILALILGIARLVIAEYLQAAVTLPFGVVCTVIAFRQTRQIQTGN